MYTILICDDDADIRAALRIYLTGEGYAVREAENGAAALELLRSEEIHLVLMDIMMPRMDGMTATARLREESNVPVILITAKSEDSDKILGLNCGADDYITKPFNPLEVTARVRSALRRYLRLGGGTALPECLTVGPIELNDAAKAVRVDGEPAALTRTEYEILKLFMTNPGRVFSPAEIYERVWHERARGADNTVAVHIRHLREKIELDPARPRYLKVVFGQGYILEQGRTL